MLLLLASDNRVSYLTSAAHQSESLRLPTEERIGRVIDYLHARYRDTLSVARLSKVAALSRSSLHRLFKLQTGATSNAYIVQLRVGHACALLISTKKPVALIAQEVGYANLANFNRQFRAVKGQTPREFRAAFR